MKKTSLIALLVAGVAIAAAPAIAKTTLTKGKNKRFGRSLGRRQDFKKAYVSLKDGYDIDFAAEAAVPLTTIRQPVRRMVDATVDILLNQIEGESAPNRIRIDGPLIKRGSVKERTTL